MSEIQEKSNIQHRQVLLQYINKGIERKGKLTNTDIDKNEMKSNDKANFRTEICLSLLYYWQGW